MYVKMEAIRLGSFTAVICGQTHEPDDDDGCYAFT